MGFKNISWNIPDDSRFATILFILSFSLALILRSAFEISYPQINGDYAHLALKAKNFIEGHGFTYGRVSLQNISEVKYEEWNLWPNGFSMLIVLFYYFTGNLINAMVLLQVAGVILLIFGLIRVCRALQLNKFIQSLFLLFTAFTVTPYNYLQTTDLLTAGLFLWIIGLTIELGANEERNLWKEIVIGILLFLSATLRYACISNIIIIPCFFIFFSWIKKDGKAFFSGMAILAYAAISTFIFYRVYTILPGRSSIANDLIRLRFSGLIHSTIYWSSLKWFDAFPLKAFFYTLPLEFRLPHNLFVTKAVRLSEDIVSLLILSYLGWWFFGKRNWIKGLKENNAIDIFTLLSIPFFIVVIATISLQSLTMPLEQYQIPWMPAGMTAVFITRYFVVPVLIIQVLFFLLLQDALKGTTEIKYMPAIVSAWLILCMLVNIVHWAYGIYQYGTDKKNNYSYWNKGEYMIDIHNMLNQDAKRNPGLNIVFVTSTEARNTCDPTIYSWSTNMIFEYDSVIRGKFQHTKPVIMYTLMQGDSLTGDEKKFISNFNAKEVSENNDKVLYRAYLE